MTDRELADTVQHQVVQVGAARARRVTGSILRSKWSTDDDRHDLFVAAAVRAQAARQARQVVLGRDLAQGGVGIGGAPTGRRCGRRGARRSPRPRRACTPPRCRPAPPTASRARSQSPSGMCTQANEPSAPWCTTYGSVIGSTTWHARAPAALEDILQVDRRRGLAFMPWSAVIPTTKPSLHVLAEQLVEAAEEAIGHLAARRPACAARSRSG